MKLPLLLSQFLYQYRKLDLPGLGSFSLDPNAVIPEASDRNLQSPASGITFKDIPIQNADDALIVFIKEHTGKMKPLAAADLDFFLTTGRQLLNIGKPFYLEGIGTLSKNNDGKLDFTPGDYVPVRLDEITEKKKPVEQNFEEPPREYEPRTNNFRQGVLLMALVIGLIAVGWGGYYLYKRNTYVETVTETPPPPVPQDTTTSRVQQDSSRGMSVRPPDTTTASTDSVVAPPAGTSLYKFVILETDRKGRALRRYNQLLGFQLNIKMEQRDSAYFKLYFPINASIRDTTHIRDSLADIYAAHVTIEK